jgi:hypothetical protein
MGSMIAADDCPIITPFVSAVAVRNGLTNWRLRSKNNLDVMTLAAAAAVNHGARS